MNSLQNTFCPRNELQFDPEKWTKRLGNECQTCNVSLTHQKSISLCKCYYFCHRSCFTSKFQSQLKDEESDVKCIQCKEILKIRLDAGYKYLPSKSLQKIGKMTIIALLLIVDVIGIALTLNSTLKHDVLYFLLYFLGLILSLLSYLIAITVRDLLYVKVVWIKQIISTKLEIETSAFKDMQLQTNQQLSKDELIFDSRKQKQ